MFQNYSQTYAANITIAVGFLLPFINNLLAKYGIQFASNDVVFVVGEVLNAGGIIWAIVHRLSKGDVTPLGVRKGV